MLHVMLGQIPNKMALDKHSLVPGRVRDKVIIGHRSTWLICTVHSEYSVP